MAERNSIFVKMGDNGLYETAKFHNNPGQFGDEMLVFTEEGPIAALVRRTDTEYIMLVPRKFLFCQSRVSATFLAAQHFGITCGVKVLWEIATDLEIAEGIRDKVPYLLSDEGFLETLVESVYAVDEVLENIEKDAGTNNNWLVFVDYGFTFCLAGKYMTTNQVSTITKGICNLNISKI